MLSLVKLIYFFNNVAVEISLFLCFLTNDAMALSFCKREASLVLGEEFNSVIWYWRFENCTSSFLAVFNHRINDPRADAPISDAPILGFYCSYMSKCPSVEPNI